MNLAVWIGIFFPPRHANGIVACPCIEDLSDYIISGSQTLSENHRHLAWSREHRTLNSPDVFPGVIIGLSG